MENNGGQLISRPLTVSSKCLKQALATGFRVIPNAHTVKQNQSVIITNNQSHVQIE